MNVEELKRHIHNELFGERFPGTSKGFDPLKKINAEKAQWKDAVMLQSITIMRRHGQRNDDILSMLQEKFMLSEEQAKEFLEQVSKSSAGNLKEV